MSILPIYNCFHPVLREVCNDVVEINSHTADFVEQMIQSMLNANGVGLAANQVGDTQRIIIVDEFAGTDNEESSPICLINPVITSSSDEKDKYQEGCLSIPQFWEDVTRPIAIEVEYYDLNEKLIKREVDGFQARVIQHEVDHLNGVLFIDRLSSFLRAMSRAKLRRIKNGGYSVGYDTIDADGNLISGKPKTNEH